MREKESVCGCRAAENAGGCSVCVGGFKLS